MTRPHATRRALAGGALLLLAAPLPAQVTIQRRPAIAAPAASTPAASASAPAAVSTGAIVAGAAWAPERLEFGALWEGQSARRTLRVTTPADGYVSATLASDVPFRIAEVRVMGAGVVTGADPTMAGRTVASRRNAPPFQVAAPTGAEVQVDVEFAPRLDLVRNPAGPKASTLVVEGPAREGAWRASVPVTGIFNGKRLAPTFVLTDGDFTSDGVLQVVFLPPPEGSRLVEPQLVSLGVRIAAFEPLELVPPILGTAYRTFLADRCELEYEYAGAPGARGGVATRVRVPRCTGEVRTLAAGEVRNTRLWILVTPPDPQLVHQPLQVSLAPAYRFTADGPSYAPPYHDPSTARTMAPVRFTLAVVPESLRRPLAATTCGGLTISGDLWLSQKGELSVRHAARGSAGTTATFGVRFGAGGRTLLTARATGTERAGSSFVDPAPPRYHETRVQLPHQGSWTFHDFVTAARLPAQIVCLP